MSKKTGIIIMLFYSNKGENFYHWFIADDCNIALDLSGRMLGSVLFL